MKSCHYKGARLIEGLSTHIEVGVSLFNKAKIKSLINLSKAQILPFNPNRRAKLSSGYHDFKWVNVRSTPNVYEPAYFSF